MRSSSERELESIYGIASKSIEKSRRCIINKLLFLESYTEGHAPDVSILPFDIDSNNDFRKTKRERDAHTFSSLATRIGNEGNYNVGRVRSRLKNIYSYITL